MFEYNIIVNQYYDPELEVWTPVEEISGELSDGVLGSVDEGIQSSFRITEDKFAVGNTRLVNFKTYYFLSVAYAYNEAEWNENPYDNVNPETGVADGRCLKWGCFMNTKAHWAHAECPIGKWGKCEEIKKDKK